MSDLPVPAKSDGVRDATTGRFVAGHPGLPGAGRPRGFDLRLLAQEEAERTGYDLRGALWAVLLKLIDQAQAGDVPAAREVLVRLGAPDDLAVDQGVTLTVISRVRGDS